MYKKRSYKKINRSNGREAKYKVLIVTALFRQMILKKKRSLRQPRRVGILAWGRYSAPTNLRAENSENALGIE
jgi:hypothetical protein